jgi:hypothetical protein
LEREAAGPGAERLGFRVCQRVHPDIDDTAMVLLALLHAKASDPARQTGRKTSHQLAVGHAIERWRMGRFRFDATGTF